MGNVIQYLKKEKPYTKTYICYNTNPIHILTPYTAFTCTQYLYILACFTVLAYTFNVNVPAILFYSPFTIWLFATLDQPQYVRP